MPQLKSLHNLFAIWIKFGDEIILIHELKIKSKYFRAVVSGEKKFEIRKNDRNFHVGDTVTLCEVDEGLNRTGRNIAVIISYMTDYEQKEGYIVFGFEKDISGTD